MNPSRPNAPQRFAHRLLMMKPVSAFLSVVLHHLDAVVLKLTRDRYTLAGIVGLPIIQLTTTGARTGQPRTMPLVSLVDGEKIAIIGTNFGGRHNPGWYYNLKANPRCTVQLHGRTAEYMARESVGAEREKYWQMGVSYYEGYEKYRIRASHRLIPVMVLEPKK
jgi:deazaflavin-dependent oxidoreductase (nitroreductase family)